MAKLADILKQEYGKKSFISGTASALGKSTLEKLDIRNLLFPGSGIGSLMGRKLFGKGYSALTTKKVSELKDTKSPTTLESTVKLDAMTNILQSINANAKITAKNSMSLPAIASQVNITQKNVSKLVRLQGQTPSTKADSFFSNAKFRENAYESAYGKASKTTSSKKEPENKPTEKSGFFGTISNILGSGLKDMFKNIVEKLIKGGLILGLTTAVLTGIGKYIDDPEFRQKVNDAVIDVAKRIFSLLDGIMKTIFGEKWLDNLKTGAEDAALAFAAWKAAILIGRSEEHTSEPSHT